MTLTTGMKLGPYEIVGLLGAGGMGEVYRARDPRIGRDVAVKVLPAAYSSDPDRLRRFEQEARSAGQLNHPNILAIHDVGSFESAPYVVSELLEGETLRERLKIGALPPRKAIEMGSQIAHGLAAAHEHGIVHRDLKPDNVFITRDGRVKILDFGLAKLTAAQREGAGAADAPTLPADTGPGAVWGTVGYMSPEQVRGNPVDHRSDIFAFGAILYEMLSGRRAFHGETSADTMSAILKEDPPDLTESSGAIPPALDRLVRHCLEKSPGERFQSARDLAFGLEAISGTSGSRAVPLQPARSRARRRALLAAAGLAGIGLVGSPLWLPTLRRTSADAPVMRVMLESPASATAEAIVWDFSISPDGRWAVFSVGDSTGTSRLWIRRLDTRSATPIPGTERTGGVFWSPDSRHIGFFSEGKLKRMPIAGGPAQEVCDAPDPRGATWSQEGVILFAPAATGGLYRVSADGGKPVPATTLDSTRHETAHRWPDFLPDGRHFLFLAVPGVEGQFDNYQGSLGSNDRKWVLRTSRAAVYAEPGVLLFSRGDLLMAQRFDRRRAKTLGDPSMIAEVPITRGNTGSPLVSSSRAGTAAFLSQPVEDTEIHWYSRSGEFLGKVLLPAGRYQGGAISPDGSRAAVLRRASNGNYDLWLVDLVRGTASPFTFYPGNETSPVWSPDGSRILYASDREGGLENLYAKPVRGGEEEIVYRSGAQWKTPLAWSPDGRHIVFSQLDPQTKADLWLLPLFGDRKPVPYLRTQFGEFNAKISPDGRWLAYMSDESGRNEVYLQSFPTPGIKYQVSTTGAGGPVWGKNGAELFFGSRRKEMSVAVRGDSTSIRLEPPKAVLEWPTRKLQRITGGAYDPHRERWLLCMAPEEHTPPAPSLVVNWPTLMKEKK